MTDININTNIDKNIDGKGIKRASMTEIRSLSSIQNRSHKYISKYGWNPDIPDHRDYQYSDLRKKIDEAEKASIVASEDISPIRDYTAIKVDNVKTVDHPLHLVDLRPTDSPIFDQGALGSCTGNALAGALQFLEKKDKVPYTELSRLFIYYDERVVENTVSTDSGAQIRDGIKTLAKLGVCSEACWPYHIQNFAAQPSQNCYKEAATHRILDYYRINTLGDMVHCLNNGYPFLFGFSVYSNFESDEVAQTGIVNMPTGNESLLGGHAVCCIGYDDNTQRFLVRNSWGISWGQQGYFTIPYAYLENRNLSDDFWTIRRGMNL